MTAVPVAAVPARDPRGHYGFTNLARMEWIKLRSLRSTGWMLGIAAAAVIGISILVMAVDSAHWAPLSAADKASWDPTNTGLPAWLSPSS